jgi:hypothetical protein
MTDSERRPVPTARNAGALPRRGSSPFLPILLISISLLSWLALQGVQLVREQQQLKRTQTGLDAKYQAATKLRAALESLATATARLAADGNANARTVVEELRKRGITIRQ